MRTRRLVVHLSMTHVRALLMVDADKPVAALQRGMSPYEIGMVHALRKGLARIAVALSAHGGTDGQLTVAFTEAQVEALAWIIDRQLQRFATDPRLAGEWIKTALTEACTVLDDAAQQCS